MSTIRKQYITSGNNSDNANKNVCALAVAKALQVQSTTRYLHTMGDLLRASRKKWDVRSHNSCTQAKGKTVGAIRHTLSKYGASAYIVHVEGHVLLLNDSGKTIVDTTRQSRDTRKIKSIYAVYPKGLLRAIENAKIISDRKRLLSA